MNLLKSNRQYSSRSTHDGENLTTSFKQKMYFKPDRHRKQLLHSGYQILARLSFALAVMLGFGSNTYAGISQLPLFLTTPAKPNTLVILDNSNSMDEDASGAAVGSNSPLSKSEIARSVIKSLIISYTDQINMGLMTYKLSATSNSYLHNSPYDVSYNPANYNPSFTGERASTTKRFRISNPTSSGNFIHYNVALPFYDTNNQGNGFCYSPTANAFNNGENPSSGPWDTYRCFASKTGTSDTLPTWSNVSSETAQGYSGLKGSFAFAPTDSDLAQGILDFGKQNTWHYVSRTYFTNSSPGRGFLNTPIRLLNTTQATGLNTVLACNIPNTPAPCTASGIKNAGLTPIEGTLLTAKDYFGGSWTNTSEGYAASGGNQTYPLPTSCDKDFVILLSDGLPSTDKTGALVADPSTAIAAAAAAAGDLKAAGVETYVVGFALPYGTDPSTLNTIAAAGGTGSAYLATDYTTLLTTLNVIFKDILSKSNSASSIASNSARLDSGTRVYQAKFDATDWSGQLQAFSVDTTTGALTPTWEASTLLPDHASRNIYTYNPLALPGSRGIEFLWANLTTTPVGASQQDHLNKLASVNDGNGALRVDWLRGDDANEQKNPGGIFRNRTSLLGDIVNSDPVYVGTEDYGYAALSGTEGSSYSAFRASGAYTGRRPMLYVGANDGMFHGFDATAGQEIFAYLPNALFPELSKLTSPSYNHQYYVDGPSGVGDVYYDSAWHTLLVGTAGAGGRAVFTLDVTNPDAFGSASVLWEFTNANDADLGYTLAQPAVVRMENGDWAVIVANGYNSDNGKAVLFVLNAKTGAVLKKIDTGEGSVSNKNGLSSPVAVDTDNNHSVDTVYAGDLYGNLWKFDVSGPTTGSWKIAIAGNKPFFVACTTTGANCSDADRQPITGKPNVGKVGGAGTDQNGEGVMVYFGTGKYFETGDIIIGASPQVQTFYGLWDKGSAITDRVLLQEQTIDFEGTATTIGGTPSIKPIRVVSKTPVCYAATSAGCTSSSPLKSGWALNLLSPVDGAEGERVVSFPLLRRGVVVFATVIPNADPCSFGGTSHLMEIDALTGGEFSGGAAFDVNGGGVVDEHDKVVIDGVEHFASGIALDVGIIKTPAVVEATSVDFKYVSGSTGNMGTVVDLGGGALPCAGAGCGGGAGGGTRRSWRQLR
ncbi:MAG: hypothetical protein EPN89_15130 [Methylovulum sp.]|nr:MAG: hypothetical protein EPN89_15130 [Methylovulum sp.]